MTSRPALLGLTHLRALAIVLVLAYHYRLFAHPAWIDRAGAFGWTGVDLFFVLSGFLIARPLFAALATHGRIAYGRFCFQRFMRIVPAYAVMLAAYELLPALRERGALPPLWKLATFTQNLGLDLRVASCFSHAWSLCIEEQFYLLLPLLLTALWTQRARRPTTAWLLPPLLLAGGLATRALAWRLRVAPLGDDAIFAWYEWIYYPTWARLDSLTTGVTLAALSVLRPATWTWLTARGQHLVWPALLAWLTAARLAVEPTSLAASLLTFPAIAAIYGALTLAALSPASWLARHRSRVTTALAKLSYALYLSHKACIHVTQASLARAGVAPDGNLMLLACLLASLAGATALHAGVERPLLAWRDRRLRAPATRR